MIKVLKSGFHTTIQDQGRSGFASFGVPISGVMDVYSANLANGILNNSLQDAMLEMTLGACEFQFLTSTCICIAGADFSPKLNGFSVAMNTKIIVKKNDVITFGKINYGARCYLAVKGGILSDKIFGSRSAFNFSKANFLVKSGDEIPIAINLKIEEAPNTSIKIDRDHFNSKNMACTPGPEFEYLQEFQKKFLFNTSFTISKNSNRMGYQLVEILKNNVKTILTSAVMPGTVQLTPSGKLIVLMRDCQVTGGYPRVLQLSEDAISKLSQKLAGDSLMFTLLKNFK